MFCLNQLLSKCIWMGMWVSWWRGPSEFQAQILLTGNKIMSITLVEHVVLSAEVKHRDAKLLMEFSICVFRGFLSRQSSSSSKLFTESKLHPHVEWVFICVLFYSWKRKAFLLSSPFLSYTAISFHLPKCEKMNQIWKFMLHFRVSDHSLQTKIMPD